MNKYVLITGASSGLGKATAQKLADEGFKVFAGVRKQEDKDNLESLNPNIKGVFIDVTDENSVKSAFEVVKQETNELFALVNNAGIAVAGPVEFIPIEFLQKQADVNVYGAIRVTQAFLPLMKDSDDSRIVNISSMASYGIIPFLSPYCVSKNALDMFFNLLLVEAKMPNLKVISIKPGVVKTPIWEKSVDESMKNLNLLSEEALKKYEKEFQILAKSALANNSKGIEPQEVADVVFKSLSIKKPKLSYNVGIDSKIARLVSMLPKEWFKFLARKALEKKEKVFM